jgi:hypothetical protein
MNELQKFYHNVRQDVQARLLSADDERGSTQEEAFTDIMTEMLVDAGETANVMICTEISEDKIGRRLHKINGYALTENYETIDLFIVVYKDTELVATTAKDEIVTVANLSEKFLTTSVKGRLSDMEESAAAFDLVNILDAYCKDIIRVNIFILTNGTTQADTPKDSQITVAENTILVKYHLWDLERFYNLYSSQNKRDAIEIDFLEDFGGAVPCLQMPVENEEYESYLAIISGETLASIYRNFGARLLEQNIRSFLQFTSKINKGIHETIKKEPQMFLAFNNGISATAEKVTLIDLPQGGKGIGKVKDFQIVNGGQTTASIFHAQKQNKLDLSKIFVQAKLTVVKKREEFAKVVSRIAEYANSQNKVSLADLSSNNPFHIELEKLSRNIWAPNPKNPTQQTRWFYERARGQYKNELNREGTTPSKKKAFEIKNPKSQVFQKETLAKYYNAWYDTPHFVVRGSQKSYVEFFKNLEKNFKKKPDNHFFEDIVAIAILFRTAENEYGTGQNAIGDRRFMVVPYTLSYLNKITEGKIDLYKIWKNQSISGELRGVIKSLLAQINDAIGETAQGKIISEWAKREECWETITSKNFGISIHSIDADLINAKNPRPIPKTETDIEKAEKEDKINRLKNVPQQLWRKILEWGRASEEISLHKQGIIETIAKRLRENKPLEDTQIQQGLEAIDLAFAHVPELFLDNEDDAIVTTSNIDITKELVLKLWNWGKNKWNINSQQFVHIKKLKDLERDLNPIEKKFVAGLVEQESKRGFTAL